MRALVVDDDPSIRTMLELILGLEGFDTASAGDGREALAQARACHPDVIVLDVMMPELDGFEVADALRRDDDLARTPIVFCTAIGHQDATWEGRPCGRVAYVSKPFETEELVEAVLRSLVPRPEGTTAGRTIA